VQFLEQLDNQSFVKNLLLKILLENGQNPPYLAFILQFKICGDFRVGPLIKVVEN
jgi:hypothetical protein